MSLFNPVTGDPGRPLPARLPEPEPPVLKPDVSPSAVETEARAAEPWTVRSELRGSQVPEGRTVPLAELAGSENYVGEQGMRHTLTQEANRQLGPAWRDGTIGATR